VDLEVAGGSPTMIALPVTPQRPPNSPAAWPNSSFDLASMVAFVLSIALVARRLPLPHINPANTFGRTSTPLHCLCHCKTVKANIPRPRW
jgi:hypothetical protein